MDKESANQFIQIETAIFRKDQIVCVCQTTSEKSVAVHLLNGSTIRLDLPEGKTISDLWTADKLNQ